MILKNKNGRDIAVDITNPKHPEDVYIEQAFYVDSGDEVFADTLEWLEETYASEIYEEWYQNKVLEAEALYEGDR